LLQGPGIRFKKKKKKERRKTGTRSHQLSDLRSICQSGE